MPVLGPKLTGIIGDKSAEAGDSRSGEDTRRRGWYWNWNTMVTQFAPLIGLDGKGLLDSYIVWTDRREDSPFRGYAFPSTTAEANFYGIDRNVLGTINKILVALDLIEIRKSMVHRPDDTGNDWKFPHNTYRVKDHGDNFQLTADGVRRVVDLAVTDTAVYRRIKHIFGSKFKPIDPQSVWYGIIAELQTTENWQKLRAIALEDERRTSERSRKGHAARRKTTPGKNPATTPKSAESTVPALSEVSRVSTVSTVGNDSDNASTVASEMPVSTTAASTSNGSETSAAQTSNGAGAPASSDAASTSTGRPTIADESSTMNYTDQTTTTTGDNEAQNEQIAKHVHQPSLIQDFGGGPDDSRDRELTLQLFKEANEKPVSTAAEKLVAKIASDFADLAQSVGTTGWALVGIAIEEAVSSGSSYVAPKRIREILFRWKKDGVPEMYVSVSSLRASSAQSAVTPVTDDADDSHKFVRTPEPRRSDPPATPGRDLDAIWSMALDLVSNDGSIAGGLLDQLRSEARLINIAGGYASVEASARVRAVLSDAGQRALQTKLSVAARTPLYIQFVEHEPIPPSVTPMNQPSVAVRKGSVFPIAGSGMNSGQLWSAVQQSLDAAGDIPRAELQMWSGSSELLGLRDETFVLGFGNAFLCRRARHRIDDLTREFSHLAGFSCEIEIVEIDVWRREVERSGA